VSHPEEYDVVVLGTALGATSLLSSRQVEQVFRGRL
jgi:hypothetical protein